MSERANDRLRAAAATLRERAEKAETQCKWHAEGLYRPLAGCRCLSCIEDEAWGYTLVEMDGPDNGACYTPLHVRSGDADLIATLDPPTARAVADLLEAASLIIYDPVLFSAAVAVAEQVIGPAAGEVNHAN